MGIFSKLTSSASHGGSGFTSLGGGGSTFQLPLAGGSREAPAPQEHQGGGVINLRKGEAINLTKTASLKAECSWPPETDYDVYALVLYRDGHTEAVAAFGTREHPSYSMATHDGAVKHQGDVGRSSAAMASETISITLTPEVAAVVPVVYSAQSNGTGSFRRYRVSMLVDNGAGQQVRVSADEASDDDNIYSCIPGALVQTPQGVQVVAVELYSKKGSERRPVLSSEGLITMDAGDINLYK